MSTERQPQSGSDKAEHVDPSESREDRLRRSSRRIDEAEADLKHEAAEAKESTEEAGHQLAGPLDESQG